MTQEETAWGRGIAQTACVNKACRNMWRKIWLWSVLSLGWFEPFGAYVYTLCMDNLWRFGCLCSLWNGSTCLFPLNSELCQSSAKSQCQSIKQHFWWCEIKFMIKIHLNNEFYSAVPIILAYESDGFVHFCLNEFYSAVLIILAFKSDGVVYLLFCNCLAVSKMHQMHPKYSIHTCI